METQGTTADDLGEVKGRTKGVKSHKGWVLPRNYLVELRQSGQRRGGEAKEVNWVGQMVITRTAGIGRTQPMLLWRKRAETPYSFHLPMLDVVASMLRKRSFWWELGHGFFVPIQIPLQYCNRSYSSLPVLTGGQNFSLISTLALFNDQY